MTSSERVNVMDTLFNTNIDEIVRVDRLAMEKLDRSFRRDIGTCLSNNEICPSETSHVSMFTL
jgi:hypothetical protein